MDGKKIYKNIFEYVLITIGCICIALAINIFLAPNTIAPGGLSGFAVILNKLTGLSVGITLLVMNIPLFFIGIMVLGKSFGVKTAYGTLVLSFFIEMFLRIIPQGYLVTNDLLLASIYGGILTGIGIGIVFRVGATTGGTDLIGAILNKFIPGLSIAKLMMIFDGMVVILAGIVDKNIETALYSAIALYIIVRVADFMVEGLGYAKAFFIISKETEKIGQEIMHTLGRGVTALEGRGMYTNSKKEVMLVVVNRGQEVRLKNIVKEIDNDAFVMVAGIHEVLGEGFKKDE